MFEAYYRPPSVRVANTDTRQKDKKLAIGIKVPGGRRELITVAHAEQLFVELKVALSAAKMEEANESR